MIYYLPIIICTLESKNGIEAADEDTAEEQIIVALDDIATHADGFKDDRVPRKNLIDTLLKDFTPTLLILRISRTLSTVFFKALLKV